MKQQLCGCNIGYYQGTMCPILSKFQMHSLYSKIWCIRLVETVNFFLLSLIAFFMRISEMSFKTMHYDALMSKNDVLYDENCFSRS